MFVLIAVFMRGSRVTRSFRTALDACYERHGPVLPCGANAPVNLSLGRARNPGLRRRRHLFSLLDAGIAATVPE